MGKFLLGVFVGWILFAGVYRSKHDNMLTSGLNGYVNRKRYEYLLKKAKARGIEQEFLDAWRCYSDVPFNLQYGMESFCAYRHAEEATQGR